VLSNKIGARSQIRRCRYTSVNPNPKEVLVPLEKSTSAPRAIPFSKFDDSSKFNYSSEFDYLRNSTTLGNSTAFRI
jgi:hypothetical protein